MTIQNLDLFRKTNDTLRYIYCMFIVIYTFLNWNDDRIEIIHFDNIEKIKRKLKLNTEKGENRGFDWAT